MSETPPEGRRPPPRRPQPPQSVKPTRMPPRPRKPGTPAPAGPPIALDTAYRMVGPVIFGMAIGYFFIDPYFHVRPWGMLGMTLFGLITGFYSMLKPLYFPSAQAAKPAEPGDAASVAPPDPAPGTGDSWDQDAWKKDDWDRQQDDWERKD